MDLDDLSAPLGQGKPQKGRKLPIAGPRVLAGVLGLFGLVVVGWVLFGDNLLGSKPVAVDSTLLAAQADASDGKHKTGHDRQNDFRPLTQATAAKQVLPPDAKIVTIIDGTNGQHQNVIVHRPASAFAPAR